MTAQAIPAIRGATGTISNSFRQYLSILLAKHIIKELKKPPYWALHTDCGKC
jgi:hypothetical protein